MICQGWRFDIPIKHAELVYYSVLKLLSIQLGAVSKIRQTAYIYTSTAEMWKNLGAHILEISLKLTVAVEKEVNE